MTAIADRIGILRSGLGQPVGFSRDLEICACEAFLTSPKFAQRFAAPSRERLGAA
jgi:hypothetical protein